MSAPTSYVDAKGRTRFHENDQLGEQLKALQQFLVVGGYPEDHAARYPKLAYALSRYPEPVSLMLAEGRLESFPGVGEIVGKIIAEFIRTGTCTKWQEWKEHTPESLLEVTTIPGLGAKTVRGLYVDMGIKNLADLKTALEAGKLKGVPGIGPKTLKSIQEHTSADDLSRRK